MAVEYQYGLKEADDLASLIRSKRALYAKIEAQDPMAKQLFYLKKEIDILVAALRRLALTANAIENEVANMIAGQMADAHRMSTARYHGGFLYLYMYESLDEVIRNQSKMAPQLTYTVPVAFGSNLSWDEVCADIKFIHRDAAGRLTLFDVMPMDINSLLPNND